jgi:hypothetical protein
MNHLLFYSYGHGPHVAETAFAILSAIRLDGVSPSAYQIVIATDTPDDFANLPVAIEAVTSEQVRDWAGPADFNHRVKIGVLAHVLAKRGGKVAGVDSDVYFLRSPARLFDRIGPGRSVMHVREGEIGHLIALGYERHRLAQMAHDLGSAGRYTFDLKTPVWNAGVLGVDAADAGLLDPVLALTDAIHAEVPTNISEQLAFSVVLNRHTVVRPTRDVVFHYHQSFIRDPFRFRLPALMRDAAHLPPAQRANTLYPHRPVAPVAKWLKAAVKRSLKPLGLFKYDLETSI